MIYKGRILAMLLGLFLLSCSKTEPKSLLEIKKDYLIGTGAALTSWKLQGLSIDSLPQTLLGSQVGYIKKYLRIELY